MSEFEPFQKIARLSRECVVTEKIDGTNGQIYIDEDGVVMAGSRNQWCTEKDDPFGFLRWVMANRDELIVELGPGRHFGEWWGSGIQRGYGLPKGEKRFSLFNTHRWGGATLKLCGVVPVLYEGVFDTAVIQSYVTLLGATGSKVAPGFMRPEGVVIFHKAANLLFKKTIEKDEAPKGMHQ
jgi:hypothetical protein